jgi:hypothetical protein
MNSITWENDHEFSIGSVNFQCSTADYSKKTDKNRFVLLKDRGLLDAYSSIFSDAVPKNILEFGVFQGGSPVFFSLWFGLDKFVGIDISAPIQEFEKFCGANEVGKK